MLWAELESLAHAPLEDAGAASVLRWHALSGYSLALTQYTGGRVTLVDGTARAAARDRRPRRPSRRASRRRSPRSRQTRRAVEVHDARRRDARRARGDRRRPAQHARPQIEFDPPLSEGKRAAIALGQASRGIKIFIRARGEAALAERDPRRTPVRLPRHRDAARRRHAGDDRLRPRRRAPATRATSPRVQRDARRRSCPGYEVARRDRPRLARRRVLARHLGDPSPRLVRAATTPRCSGPRAACYWPAPTSRTAGPASSTARSRSGLTAAARLERLLG